MHFAVIFMYNKAWGRSIDTDDIVVYLYGTLDDAQKMLLDSYNFNIDESKKVAGADVIGHVSQDKKHASIKSYNNNKVDITEIYIAKVYE